jgi:hypothetical protein
MMLSGSGYIPILKRATEQSPEARRSRTLRNDDLVAIAMMVGFFAVMLFIGIGVMWAFTPTRHSEPLIDQDHAATTVPVDQIRGLRLH